MTTLGSIDGELVQSRPRPDVALLTIASKPLGVLRASVQGEIARAIRELEEMSDIRAVVITGLGRAFSVGGDIKEFRQDPQHIENTARREHALYGSLEHSRLPFVAACNGLTLGGGLELALACDVRVAGESAQMGLPEIGGGGIPAGGATQRLPRIIGLGNALEMLLTGRILTAQDAYRVGMVTAVTHDDALLGTAIEIAGLLASMPSGGIGAIKRCVYEGQELGLAAGLEMECAAAIEVGMSYDASEGQSAFIAKRRPVYNQKRDDVR